jgi:prepilin-type N-terminal cleavage/methylation domain-containing protein
MKIKITTSRLRSAFTLVEVAMTTAILGVILASFYSGIAAGFAMIGLARENLRGDQILLEKTETLRLYSWDQINTAGFIPATFTAPFYPPIAGQTNGNAGVTYYGRVTITNAPFNVSYATNLKLVTVSLTWTNGHNARVRSMETLVSEFGMQTYIY